MTERRPSSWAFLQAFLRAHKTIGAVAPTSRGVAQRIARLAHVDEAHAVAEFGPGTGAITRELLAALPADGHLEAFEVYPPFLAQLRETIHDPRFTLRAESAEAIRGANAGEQGFDAVVSSLPFSLIGPEQTRTILRAAIDALRPGGVFVALQYHPRYLHPLMQAEFAKVERTMYAWNLPPVLLLRGSNPRGNR